MEKYETEIQNLVDLNKQANVTKEQLELNLNQVTQRLKPLISKKAAAALKLGTKRSGSTMASRLSTAKNTNTC